MNSWRSGTTKQYRVYLNKWETFALDNDKDPICPTVSDILEFFASLFDSGLGYSALNTARAALSSAVDLSASGFAVGTHPLIIRFMKGVFQSRPSLPRYTSTWDVATVLNYLKNQSPARSISLKTLSLKLVMLCLLVTGSRGQTIHLLDLDDMHRGKSSFTFTVSGLVKQSKPGQQQPKVKLNTYPADRRLCVVTYMNEYLTRTEDIRPAGETAVFVSYTRPHKPVSRATISRWVKVVMVAAGINTGIFKPHSTRAASTSAAAAKDTPLDVILSTAGWNSSGTFGKFYNKNIQPSQTDTFGYNILHSA